VHSGIWETVADTLFWMQLIWILSGFCFMAYLAFRVFPHRGENGETASLRTAPHEHRERMITAKYRFEDFPCYSNSSSQLLRRESSGESYTFNSSISDRRQDRLS
jgi:hypothetical protein